jgi:hypothetical protein
MNLEFINKLDTLVVQCINDGIQLNSGISADLITQLEADFEFLFDINFKYYLQKINGFKDFDADDTMFTFWSYQRIIEENENGSHPAQVIWFADHSMNLCTFGFHKTDKKVYTHFDKRKEIIFIADSFSSFLDIYLDDPYRLVL